MENFQIQHSAINSEAARGHSQSGFIEANTVPMQLEEIRDKHIIPVFLKDNEPTISQVEFVEVMTEAAREVFGISALPSPQLRVSHPIKGRVYEARHKKASDLMDNEKTIYYERMAMLITIPGFTEEINGNTLELNIGGVKAYNLDNLNSTKGSKEHFKFFVGFKNMVCTNLCISTDGAKMDCQARSLDELYAAALDLFRNYNAGFHMDAINGLTDYSLTEKQFAQIVGKSRLYQYLPKEEKQQIPELLINDTMISKVADCYFSDKNFNRSGNGEIDLWRFYNLLTGAVKSSYIDRFIEREVNSFDFTLQIKEALDRGHGNFWYLN
ncbi:DUF3871 family protein [Cyclobacterium xiamenense]|uniref:DUF3871 family protein n=1 Tax=Cyclobacterium xiamenense TaxID=1297121 RepID=UPI0035CEFFAB